MDPRLAQELDLQNTHLDDSLIYALAPHLPILTELQYLSLQVSRVV